MKNDLNDFSDNINKRTRNNFLCCSIFFIYIASFFDFRQSTVNNKHAKAPGNLPLVKTSAVEEVPLIGNLKTSQPNLLNRNAERLIDDLQICCHHLYLNFLIICLSLISGEIAEEEADDRDSGYGSDSESRHEVSENSGDGAETSYRFFSRIQALCNKFDDIKNQCVLQQPPKIKFKFKHTTHSRKSNSLSLVLKSRAKDTEKAPCFQDSNYSKTVSSEAFETVPYSCRDNGADDTTCIAASDALKNNNDDDDDDSSEIRDSDIDSDAAEDTDETSPVHSSQEHGTTETNDMATYTSTTTATTGTNTLSVVFSNIFILCIMCVLFFCFYILSTVCICFMLKAISRNKR